ncbi:hypothetical protein C8R45DRAFT_1080628 [Mycena sanguinolenta]|nr:hypothetical protein C8R45DRAFT_1080628 [Mycena sanguinolenta]
MSTPAHLPRRRQIGIPAPLPPEFPPLPPSTLPAQPPVAHLQSVEDEKASDLNGLRTRGSHLAPRTKKDGGTQMRSSRERNEVVERSKLEFGEWRAVFACERHSTARPEESKKSHRSAESHSSALSSHSTSAPPCQSRYIGGRRAACVRRLLRVQSLHPISPRRNATHSLNGNAISESRKARHPAPRPPCSAKACIPKILAASPNRIHHALDISKPAHLPSTAAHRDRDDGKSGCPASFLHLLSSSHIYPDRRIYTAKPTPPRTKKR